MHTATGRGPHQPQRQRTVIQEMRKARHLGADTGAASSARSRGTKAGMLKEAGDAATMSCDQIKSAISCEKGGKGNRDESQESDGAVRPERQCVTWCEHMCIAKWPVRANLRT